MDIALLVLPSALAGVAVLRGLAHLLFAEPTPRWAAGIGQISAGIAMIAALVRIDSAPLAALAVLAIAICTLFLPVQFEDSW